MTDIRFSIIIPVYNRPKEISELLESLYNQSFKNFDVIVVDDGSSQLSEKVTRDYMGKLAVKYYYKLNSGPGLSRNYGMERAEGNYFIILDSDVIVPKDYMAVVAENLQQNYVDAFGGPDAAMESFTPLQKAINFAMTSFLTTGGIRGASEKTGKFHPRSFNMGLSKEVFRKTGGFLDMRYGEDIDLSIRIMQSGFKTKLIPEAFVYHKRRNDLKSFFNQVKHSGEARVFLHKKYPKSLKIVHFFPAVFTLGLLLSALLFLIGFKTLLLLYFLYFLVLIFSASIKYKDIKLGFLSAIASFVMLIGYGWGFIKSFVR